MSTYYKNPELSLLFPCHFLYHVGIAGRVARACVSKSRIEPEQDGSEGEEVKEILAILNRLEAKRAREAASAASFEKGTAFERIKRYFEKVGNQPSSTRVICMQTGLARGAVSNVIYTTHADLFEATASRTTKRKLWSMKGRSANVRDMRGLKAHEAARKIILENDNEPLHALTIAREALKRGYKGKSESTGDELLWITAKSFWARLARTNRDDFEQPRHMYFRVRNEDHVDRQPGLDFGES